MSYRQTMKAMGAQEIPQLHVYHQGVLVTFHENDQQAISTAMDLLLADGRNMESIELELKWKKIFRI